MLIDRIESRMFPGEFFLIIDSFAREFDLHLNKQLSKVASRDLNGNKKTSWISIIN